MKHRRRKSKPQAGTVVRSADRLAGGSGLEKNESLDRRKFIEYVGIAVAGFTLVGMPGLSRADGEDGCPAPYTAAAGDICDPSDNNSDICYNVSPPDGDECSTTTLALGDNDECWEGTDPPFTDDRGDKCEVDLLAVGDTDQCFTFDLREGGDRCDLNDDYDDDKCWYNDLGAEIVGDQCDKNVSSASDTDECIRLSFSADVCDPTVDPAGENSDLCASFYKGPPMRSETGDECNQWTLQKGDKDVCSSPYRQGATEGGDQCLPNFWDPDITGPL